MADIFEIVGKISLDGLDKAEKDLKGFSNEGEKSSSKLSKIGKIAGTVGKGVLVGAGAVTAGAVGLVKQVSSSYGQLQQSIGGIETLFKDSAQKVIENANNAYTTAGISANEYMQQVTSFSASLLQSLDGDTEAAANAADMAVRDMADNANKMGTSMEMIQNAYQGFSKQNYTMLDNLKLGYGGTKTEMERLLADAEKISGIKYDISNLNDVYSAIHVIQGELGITGTTALEAGETIEGSFNSLSASWQNFIAGLGNPDADMAQIVDNLAKGLSGAINNVIPIINNMVSVLPTVMDAIIGAISELAPTFIKTFTSLITQVIDGIVKLLPTIIPLIVDTLKSVINALVSNLPLIIDAVILLVTEVINALSEMLPELIPTIIQALVDISYSLIENLPILLDAVLQIIFALAEGIVEALPTIIEALLNALPMLIDALTGFLSTSLPQIIDGAIQLFMGIIDALPVILDALVNALPSIISSVINFFTENIPVLLNGSIQLFMALVQAVPQISLELLKAMPDIINAIFEGLADLPSKLSGMFSDIWENIKGIFSNVDSVFSNIFGGAWESVKSSFSGVFDFFSGVWENIKGIFSSVGSWFGDTFGGAWKSIKGVFDGWGSFFSGLWDDITRTFSKIGTNISNAMSDSVKSGLNGVIDGIENIINSGISLINGAIGLINNLPGVEVGKIDELSLPRFAKGGVVDEPTIAEIGEDGKEAVVPLENNLGWIKALAEKLTTEFSSIILPNNNSIDNVITESPMQQYQVSFNTQFDALNDRVDQLIDLIAEYLPDISNNMEREIVLDSGAIAVGISRRIDKELGRISTSKGRGNV